MPKFQKQKKRSRNLEFYYAVQIEIKQVTRQAKGGDNFEMSSTCLVIGFKLFLIMRVQRI